MTMRFDGIEPIGPNQWKDTPARVAAYLHKTQPVIMLSNHGGAPEDFVSFERMVGPSDRRQPWEMTEIINPTAGYGKSGGSEAELQPNLNLPRTIQRIQRANYPEISGRKDRTRSAKGRSVGEVRGFSSKL